MSAADELRQAARLMREQHGPEHPRHAFWQALCGLLSECAADYDETGDGPYGAAGAAFAAGRHGGDPDPAIMVARAYLAAP